MLSVPVLLSVDVIKQWSYYLLAWFKAIRLGGVQLNLAHTHTHTQNKYKKQAEWEWQEGQSEDIWTKFLLLWLLNSLEDRFSRRGAQPSWDQTRCRKWHKVWNVAILASCFQKPGNAFTCAKVCVCGVGGGGGGGGKNMSAVLVLHP